MQSHLAHSKNICPPPERWFYGTERVSVGKSVTRGTALVLLSVLKALLLFWEVEEKQLDYFAALGFPRI
jgi:hypothetical protein